MSRAKRKKLESAPLPSYSTGEVCRLTGATPRQIESWVKAEIIRSDLPSSGRGDHRGFTFRNLVEVRIAVLLGVRGTKDHSAKWALLELRLMDDEDWIGNHPDTVRLFAELHKSIGYTARQKRAVERQLERAREAEMAPLYQRLGAELQARGVDAEPKAWLEAESAKLLTAWQQFKNPATRAGDRGVFLCEYEAGLWTMLADLADLQRGFAQTPAFRVLNLRQIFEGLERATGDRWRGWSELEGGDR